ncbi:MAG: hypothetical protein GXO49_05290 [Chlorobi bacterium]|nr:hypothetical protein [Chlorobiota bacterium]
MLEELLAGLKNDALGAINDHPDVPNEKLGDIMDVIGNVTKEHVAKEAVNSNGLGNLMNLFSESENNENANSLQSNIMNSVIDGLMGKAGLGKSGASAAASAILPMVLNAITSKNSSTPDDDASPLMDIFGSVLSSAMSGGNSKSGGIMGALGNLFKK